MASLVRVWIVNHVLKLSNVAAPHHSGALLLGIAPTVLDLDEMAPEVEAEGGSRATRGRARTTQRRVQSRTGTRRGGAQGRVRAGIEEYEAEQARRDKQRKARVVTFERIIEQAPTAYSTVQMHLFLRLLVHLEHSFLMEVANHFANSDENSQQSDEEILLAASHCTADEKLFGGACASSSLTIRYPCAA